MSDISSASNSGQDANKKPDKISVACPSCGTKLSAPTNAIGKKARCVSCKSVFVISVPSLVHRAPAIPQSPEEVNRDETPRAGDNGTSRQMKCWKCVGTLTVTPQMAGTSVVCPNCSAQVPVPAELFLHDVSDVNHATCPKQLSANSTVLIPGNGLLSPLGGIASRCRNMRLALALTMLVAITGIALYWWLHHSSNGANAQMEASSDIAALKVKASNGDAASMRRLGIMYRNGVGVPKDKKQAIEWHRKAAEDGNPESMCDLGVMYILSEGVPEDNKQAAVWFRKAAELGNTDAMLMLGKMYREGDGVSQDNELAIKWIGKAAELSNPNAMLELGLMYKNGIGVPEDKKEAAEWFHKAAEHGNTKSMSNLGIMYAKGEGVPKDEKQAAEWNRKAYEAYRKAADNGDADAMLNLGMMYYAGVGITMNDTYAYMWAYLSMMSGNDQARELLASLKNEMTRAKIDEALRLSGEWMKKHK